MAGERTFKKNVTWWDLHQPTMGSRLTPSWMDLANGWTEAVPLEWAAQDRRRDSSHPITGANRPPRRRQNFHLEDPTITVARPESLA